MILYFFENFPADAFLVIVPQMENVRSLLKLDFRKCNFRADTVFISEVMIFLKISALPPFLFHARIIIKKIFVPPRLVNIFKQVSCRNEQDTW